MENSETGAEEKLSLSGGPERSQPFRSTRHSSEDEDDSEGDDGA